MPIGGKKSNDSGFLSKNYEGQKNVAQNFQELKEENC